MDIHAPDKPVHSWKDFLVHILIVTVGILIALGLDGVREHIRERRLVRETREAVRLEMQANQSHMRAEMVTVTAYDLRLKKLADGLPGNLRDHPDQVALELNAGYNPVYFFAVNSWQVALSTGALAHMNTEEVAAYAYAAQGIAEYRHLQEQAWTQESTAKALFKASPRPAGAELATATQDLVLLSRAEEALANVGPQVEHDIDRALQAAQ